MSRATPIVLAVLLLVSALGVVPMVQAAPAINSLTPTSGPTNGGTEVTIKGSGFLDGALVEIGGISATDIQVHNATTITVKSPARPSAAANQAVVVTNPDGSKSTSGVSFTYTASANPVITSFAPTLGSTNGGTTVVIQGSGFSTEVFPEVTIAGSRATVQSASATSIVAVTTGHAITDVAGDVVVKNPGSSTPATSPSKFTYTLAALPFASAIAPISGTTNGGTVVTVDGANLAPGATVAFEGPTTLQADGVAFVSATQLSVVTPVFGLANVGIYDVVVTNPDGQEVTLAAAFTATASTLPTVNAITPVKGPTTGGTPVVISGSNFVPGDLSVMIGGVAASNVKFVSNSQITATTGACGACTGSVDVVVANPDGGASTTGTGLFSYAKQVAITSISPATVPTSGGTVNLGTSGFSGTCRVFVGGVEATSVTACSSFVAPPSAPGTKDIQVIDNGGAPTGGLTATWQGGLGYTLAAPPTLGAPNPTSVNTNGGQVTVSGTGFICVAGADAALGTFVSPVVKFNALVGVITGCTASTLTVQVPPVASAATTETCGAVSPPIIGSAPACLAASISVTNLDGQTVTRAARNSAGDAQFSYTPSPDFNPLGTAICDDDDVDTTNDDPCVTSITDGGTEFTPPNGGFVTGTKITRADGTSYRVNAGVIKVGANVATYDVVAGILKVRVPPAAAAGSVALTFTNPDGKSDTLAGYVAYAKPAAPTILALTTTSGSANGDTLVTINGVQGTFGAGATVFFGQTPVVIRWPEPCDAAGVTENCVGGAPDHGQPGNTLAQEYGTAGNTFRVRTPGHVPGTVAVKVVNLDGQTFTLTNAYTFLPEQAPVIAAVTPDQAPGLGGNEVVLTGTDFAAGGVEATATLDKTYLKPTVIIGGVTLPRTDVEVLTSGNNGGSPPTACTATNPCLKVTLPNRPPGVVSIFVINPDGQPGNLQNSFRYLGTQTGVTITPNAGSQDGGIETALAGIGFDPLSPAPIVLFGGAIGTGSSAASTGAGAVTTPADPTPLSPGFVDVQLVDQDGQTLTVPRGYTYTRAVPPSFASLAPVAGSVNGGTLVTIKGSGFAEGVKACMAVPGPSANAASTCTASSEVKTLFVDASTIQIVTAHSAPGPATIGILNPVGAPLFLPAERSLFSYSQAPSPVITSVSPTDGNTTGGTAVTLTGVNFASGAQVFFDTEPATNVVVESATKITALSPAHEAGAVGITVVSPGGLAYTLVPAFTYTVNGTAVPDDGTGGGDGGGDGGDGGDGEPEPVVLTSDQMAAANRGVVVTVTREGDANVIAFTLPANPPAPIAGVQVWRSNSPFVLAADLPAGTPSFTAGKFTDTSPDAKASTQYVVTVYYADGQGKATSSDPQTVPGFDSLAPASVPTPPADEDDNLMYYIVGGVVLLLLMILLIVVVVQRGKKGT